MEEYIEEQSMMTPQPPKHILSLNKDEMRQFLNSFDYVFCDCDGVIWDLEKIIEGSGEAINLLKNAGKHFVYVTNNSVRSIDNYLQQFEAAGIKTHPDDVVHPSRSIVEYLKKIKFDGLIYCIAAKSFKNSLTEAGFKIIDGPNEILEENYAVLARHIFDKEPVRAVIIDVDFNLSATKLIRAQQYLNHPDCILIAGATDKLLPVKKNVSIIGPGAFLQVLTDATKKRPSVLGKPGWDLGQILLNRYGIKNPKRVLVIGDMLEQDISFGKICGFKTLAVLTGGCKEDDLKNFRCFGETPHYFAKSIGEFKQFFQTLAN